MTITSFYYLAFLSCCAFVFYILPKKIQWVELLIFSIIFYIFATQPYTFLYLLVCTLFAYMATCYMHYSHEREGGRQIAVERFLTVTSIAVSFIFWLIFNGSSFLHVFTTYVNKVLPFVPVFRGLSLATALGMGYYTLRIIGYILDCYWESIEPQRNFLKLLLFVCFFPQMISGPISGYDSVTSLYECHRLQYKNIAFGSQRILWGFYKVLVAGDRLAIIVNGIVDAEEVKLGFFPWIAVLIYPLQLYLNFSGSMDIMLGSAEIFGIRLEENFDNPFFARSVKEFWQRWHITLGAWVKNYVLFPILHTKLFKKISDFCIKKFGKNIGKFISTQLGMLILWSFVGTWHGRVRYIIGVTLWYWLLLFLGDLFSPVGRRITVELKCKTESFGWKLFQVIRTYILFAIGAVTFRADNLRAGISFLGRLTTVFTKEGFNPWIFFDESIVSLGASWVDVNIIFFSLLLLLIVGYLRLRYGYARNWIAEQSIGLRWFIWLFLFAFILVYGQYGSEYDATEFIYQGF